MSVSGGLRWLMAGLVALTAGSAAAQLTPLRGAPGLNDPVYPLAGNGGYTVDRYDVALAWNPETGVVDGDTTVHMTVLEPLAAFNLDYSGPEIATVTVAGRQATWSREDHELKIDVPVSGGLRIGEAVDVRVVYRGVPATLTHPVLGEIGWLPLDDGAVTASMPDATRAWMPVNGHPSDKAIFAFRLSVPEPYVAVAPGRPGEVEERNGSRTFAFETVEPIRPDAAFVAFGRLHPLEQEGPGAAGTRLQVWVDDAVTPEQEARLANLGSLIDDEEADFGPFPFEETAVVAIAAGAPASLSAQPWLALTPATLEDPPRLAHQLALQWWGGSVTPETWGDIWLQEGLATYAEVLWVEAEEGREAALALLEQWDTTLRQEEEASPAESGTPAMLFDRTTGLRGALIAHALRQQLGDGPFLRVLRTFNERFGHDVASVTSFIAVAQELSGQDLGPWQAEWLSATTLPALP